MIPWFAARRRLAAAAGLAASVAAIAVPGWVSGAPHSVDRRDAPIVVGSKNFPENRLLAEMFARLLESHAGLEVERRFNLAGTHVCLEALRTGAIDLYPEYTGTGLVSILREEPTRDPATAFATVHDRFLERWGLKWLPPLGFENAYELAVPAALADRHGLSTISDLAEVAPGLRAAFGFEFMERPDGLPGLADEYGLRFGDVRAMQQALKYRSVAAGEIDALDVYTTDGRLLVHDLVVLEDDRGFFPPYEAAPLARNDLVLRYPRAARALESLAGRLSGETMRGLNLRLQVGGEPVQRVARDALRTLGLSTTGQVASPSSRETGVLRYMWDNRAALLARTAEHLTMSGAALALGVLAAVPLGLLLERRRRFAETVIRIIGITQTLPSIALLAFMIPMLGVGVAPAVAALWVYSLFPIVRNTYTGVRDADPAAVEAAWALGMTRVQVLRNVRLPLAMPFILAGVRTAAVLTVGTATLAAFIGAGGLGEPIVAGLQLADTRRILSGAIPAALLALAVDTALGFLERRTRPRGVTGPAGNL